jgi:hypothetical protein
LAAPDALVWGVEDHHGKRVVISSAVGPQDVTEEPLSAKSDDVAEGRSSSASGEVLIGNDVRIADVNGKAEHGAVTGVKTELTRGRGRNGLKPVQQDGLYGSVKDFQL